MNPGTLKQRITITQRTVTQDALGQPVDTWATVATLWADMRFRGGLEAIQSDAEVSVARVSVRIRYRTGLDAGMRVTHAGVNYNIEAVLPDLQGKSYCDLVCTKVT